MGAGKKRAHAPRIALFDNLKGILIVLVVFGHIAIPVQNDTPPLSFLFDTIYLFHMPLFVFLSGIFAKGAWRDGRLNVNRIISFVVLGVVFQAALVLINGMAITPWRLIRFTSAPWYIVAMAWWYLATPALSRLGAARGMAASLGVALAFGCIDLSNGVLALGRAAAFLPCFAAGYYLKPQTIERLSRRRELWVAVVIAAAFVVARILDERAFSWFFPMVYGDNPYPHLAGGGLAAILTGAAAKLFALGAALVCSLAVLRLAPKNTSVLTTLGRRSLQIYVLHRIFCAWLRYHTPLYDTALVTDPVFGVVIALALTALTTALCALPIFERPFARALSIRWLPTKR